MSVLKELPKMALRFMLGTSFFWLPVAVFATLLHIGFSAGWIAFLLTVLLFSMIFSMTFKAWISVQVTLTTVVCTYMVISSFSTLLKNKNDTLINTQRGEIVQEVQDKAIVYGFWHDDVYDVVHKTQTFWLTFEVPFLDGNNKQHTIKVRADYIIPQETVLKDYVAGSNRDYLKDFKDSLELATLKALKTHTDADAKTMITAIVRGSLALDPEQLSRFRQAITKLKVKIQSEGGSSSHTDIF